MLHLKRPLKRIVVLRANGLGDFLFATPALRALAKAFPEAEITYLCRPWLRNFIDGRYPYIHRAKSIPYYPKLHEPPDGQTLDIAAVEDFFVRMSEEQFDLAIQMHGGGLESNPFLSRLGAAHTLALTGRNATPLEANLRYVYYQPEVLRYLELVAQVGVQQDGLELDLPLLPSDFAALRASSQLAGVKHFVVLHPGASDPRRRWPPDRYARVAERLVEHYGKTVVVGGGAAEADLAEQVVALSRVPVVNLAGNLAMSGYAALLSQADLFVGNDTGPAHMAFALGVPSVVIYWCGNLINAGPPTRAANRPVLSWTLDCPACGERKCRCKVSFAQDAALDEVLENITDLLENVNSNL